MAAVAASLECGRNLPVWCATVWKPGGSTGEPTLVAGNTGQGKPSDKTVFDWKVSRKEKRKSAGTALSDGRKRVHSVLMKPVWAQRNANLSRWILGVFAWSNRPILQNHSTKFPSVTNNKIWNQFYLVSK